MAVRTKCNNCGKSFSAPDDYLGSKFRCPNCRVKVAVLSDDDRARESMEKEERRRWQEEQDQRIDLIESMDKRRRDEAVAFRSQSYAYELGTGVDRVRNFNPGALSRFRKLRALSHFLILLGYLLIGLLGAAAGTLCYMYWIGEVESVAGLALRLIGILVGTLVGFAGFKFLGELSWLVADIGDHQLDVRNLLLDLRDNSDRRLLDGELPARTPESATDRPSQASDGAALVDDNGR